MDKLKKAVVLLSGGMDSAVTLAIAKMQNYDVAALHLNYGQRTEKRELQSFQMLTHRFGINQKLIVDVKYLNQIGGSSLTDSNIEVSDVNLESDLVPSSYVPFRNANILSIAVSWAESINAEAIFIGAVHEDSSGYPDTRPEFFAAYQLMANLGTKPETIINIETPIIHLSKKDIITKGINLGVPFELTWSCYKNNDKACGKCDSCALRLRGFSQLSIPDPIEYEI